MTNEAPNAGGPVRRYFAGLTTGGRVVLAVVVLVVLMALCVAFYPSSFAAGFAETSGTSTPDEVFQQQLDAHGLMLDTATAQENAHTICRKLQAGQAMDVVRFQVWNASNGVPEQDSDALVQSAVTAYCPDRG